MHVEERYANYKLYSELKRLINIFNIFLCIKLGCLLTGVFAENSVAQMAGGPAILGGWINNNVNNSLFMVFIFMNYLKN